MKNLPFSILFILISFQLFAQDNLFTKVYYDFNYDAITSYNSALTFDDGIISVGDKLILKIDSKGNPNWNKTINYENHIIKLTKIAKSVDSSYIIIGEKTNMTTGVSTSYFLKISLNGAIIWSKSLTANYKLTAITQNFEKGFIICGNYYDTSNKSYRPILLSINNDGELNWSKVYSGENYDNHTYDVVVLNDSSIIMTGQSRKCNSCNNVAFLMSFNQNGEVQWSKTYNKKDAKYNFGSVIKSKDDQIYCLITNGLMKTDKYGNLVWAKFDKGIFSQNNQFIFDSSNQIIIESGDIGNKTNLIRLNIDGEITSSLAIAMIPNNIFLSKKSKLIIVGNGPLLGATINRDIYPPQIGIIKTDSLDKTKLYCQAYSNTSISNDSIIIDTFTNNYIKTISIDTISFNLDSIKTISRDCCVDHTSANQDIPNELLIQISPNPTTGIIKIVSEIDFRNAQAICYTLDGKIAKLVNNLQNNSEIDLSELNKGMYFLKIKSKEKISVFKIVIE